MEVLENPGISAERSEDQSKRKTQRDHEARSAELEAIGRN
jgi:hypothetical protein